MDFTKEEIIKELDLLVGCLTRLTDDITFVRGSGDFTSYMKPSIEGNYIELNELEEKVENLKSKILGE